MSAYATDFKAMGLAHYQPYQSAFTAVPPRGVDKEVKVPKQRASKPKQLTYTSKGVQLSEQRALDQLGRATVDLAPRTAGGISIHSHADALKTSRIARGRSI